MKSLTDIVALLVILLLIFYVTSLAYQWNHCLGVLVGVGLLGSFRYHSGDGPKPTDPTP